MLEILCPRLVLERLIRPLEISEGELPIVVRVGTSGSVTFVHERHSSTRLVKPGLRPQHDAHSSPTFCAQGMGGQRLTFKSGWSQRLDL